MSKKLISILLSLAMVAGASATISVNADENETTTTKTKETTSTVDVNKFGDADGKVLTIEEKPQCPKSNYAVVGLYFYPNKVIKIAENIRPSERGELEITTVNQEFLKDNNLNVQLLGRGFAWLDTGTHDSLSEASTFIEVIEKRQGLKVACLEAIAYRQGWITEKKMLEIAGPMIKNQYGQYLVEVVKEQNK